MGIKIRKLDKKYDVYDITVKDNHNFFGNSVLVHNCIEITLPTNEERTAVCCLSSLNLEKYDEWKDSLLVQDLTCFLDNVLQYFIDNAPDEISKAKYSATQERSIGIGAMGWHNLLMKKSIPFESQAAAELNEEVFSLIKDRAVAESIRLGKEKGGAPDLATDIEIELENGQVWKYKPTDKVTLLDGTSKLAGNLVATDELYV